MAAAKKKAPAKKAKAKWVPPWQKDKADDKKPAAKKKAK